MTVRELKEKLEQFPENLIVMIPNAGWHPYSIDPPEIPAANVIRGVNEFDGCIIIDDYAEEEEVNSDCYGCVYEDADGSTPAISNCVCCSRNVDYAKNDNYRRKLI